MLTLDDDDDDYDGLVRSISISLSVEEWRRGLTEGSQMLCPTMSGIGAAKINGITFKLYCKIINLIYQFQYSVWKKDVEGKGTSHCRKGSMVIGTQELW